MNYPSDWENFCCVPTGVISVKRTKQNVIHGKKLSKLNTIESARYYRPPEGGRLFMVAYFCHHMSDNYLDLLNL